MQSVRLTPFWFTATRTSILGALVCSAFLTGCDGASEPVVPIADPTTSAPPSAPEPQPITPASQHDGSVAGFVIDESQCVIGARVELLDGPHAGAVFVQTMCDFWGYGDDTGFVFHELPLGKAVTVRATAKGYLPAEILAIPKRSYSYTTMIALRKEN